MLQGGGAAAAALPEATGWLALAAGARQRLSEHRMQETTHQRFGLVRAPWQFRNCGMGGRHTEKEYPESNISMQEAMFLILNARDYQDAQELTVRLQNRLKEIIEKEEGCRVMGIGLEGGLAPYIDKGEFPLPEVRLWAMMKQTIEECGYRPGVDVAIALDTSGSMENLLEAARLKLWEIVHDLTLVEPTPTLRVALLTYGGKDNDHKAGWVRVETGLTRDLDLVSERLFALTAGGGAEYVARVLQAALEGLDWTSSEDALKLVFVAGNEPADQEGIVVKVAGQPTPAPAVCAQHVVTFDHAGDQEVSCVLGRLAEPVHDHAFA